MKNNKKYFKISKRAQIHIEAILSILIFIGFIFALFYLIRPFETPNQKSNNIEIIKTNLPQYLMANITQKGLNVLTNIAGNCFYIPQSMNGNTKVVADNGSEVESKSTTNDFYIMGKKGFYTIYTSDDFTESSIDTSSCPKIDNYRFSITSNVEVLSYKKIVEFNTSYWNNYDETKTTIKIPESNEYGFLIIDMKGSTIVNSFNSPTTAINLEVKEVSMPMVYSNGTIQNIRMRIYSY